MQKLWYNSIALHDLGELQILGQSGVKEPPEAPQRERRTLRVRLNVWQQTYADNAGVVASVIAALSSQQATLQWQDENGSDHTQRTVTVGDFEQPDAENAQGTYRQSIVFSFWYYIHNLATNCLPAIMSGGGARPALNLGAVERWDEALNTELFDPMKDARKRLEGMVSASGRFQGDTTAPLEDRRAALLALKDQFAAEIQKGVSMNLAYGTFNQQVRVISFKVSVNQPMCCIEWTLTATYTAYPDETGYYWLDYTLTRRVANTSGVKSIILAGRMGATDEATARTRLTQLYTGSTAVIPVANSPINQEITPRQVESKGGALALEGAFTELTFTLEFFDTTAANSAVIGNVANPNPLDLGFVYEWNEGLDTELFDLMKDARKRLTGSIAAKGRFTADPGLDENARTSSLLALKDRMVAEIQKGAAMNFNYGSFNRSVRVASFKAAVDQAKNVIEWTLAATYTAYPDESNYYWLDYTISRREDKATGITAIVLAGKIGATSEAVGKARLSALHTGTTSVIPTANSPISEQCTPRQVESKGGAAAPEGAFVELDFTLEFYDTTSAVVGSITSNTGGTAVDLGFVHEWNEGLDTELFDPMKDARKRLTGSISVKGRYTADASQSMDDRRTALLTLKDRMVAEIQKGASMNFSYGSFNRSVRVISFKAAVDQVKDVIEWILTATYTAYPDESNYYWLDYTLAYRENGGTGVRSVQLSGKIGAANEAMARARLAQLYTGGASVIPTTTSPVSTDITPRQVESKGGELSPEGAFIELVFTLEFYDLTGVVTATIGNAANPSPQDMGFVYEWSEGLDTELFDPMKDARKRLTGSIAAHGRYTGDASQSQADRTAALLAVKDAMTAEIQKGAAMNFNYGSFNKKVRITSFKAMVNQPRNVIEWTLTATYTAYPDESNYYWLDYTIARRENKTTGITTILLSGKMGATSEAVARSRLTQLYAGTTAVIPANSSPTSVEITPRQVESKGGAVTAEGAFVEITFNLEFFDTTNAIVGTATNAVGGSSIDLGFVYEWNEGLDTELFDPMRDARKRLTGSLAIKGRFTGDQSQSDTDRRTALLAKKDQMIAEIKKGAAMNFSYGSFNQSVRVINFRAMVNQATDVIEWTLTATYTAYPDESNYYWLDYTLGAKENKTTGITTVTLSGRLGATDEATARARLAQLYTGATAVTPANTSPISADITPRRVESKGGSATPEGAFIELAFSLDFFDTTSAIAGHITSATGGAGVDLGFVYEWSEGLDTDLFDPMKDARKRLTGNISAKGRFTGDATLNEADRATALLAIKDKMIAEIKKGASMNFNYGSFNQTVRVTTFRAMVNQPRNVIEWTLTATYTAYPDESNYYWLDYTLASKVVESEGITTLTLAGKIGATSEATARARLAALYGGNTSLIPAGYIRTITDITPRQVESRSATATAEGAFTELNFTVEFRDTTTITLTYQKGNNGTPLDLGVVEKFTDRYNAQLFDDMKSDRRHADGTVSASGKIFQPDTATLDTKRAELTATKAALDTAFNQGSFGLLAYGGAFSQTVRVVDWNCQVNRLMNCLEWSLSATYVRFPDPSNYAVCEFNFSPKQNKIEGTVTYSLTGKIAASSVEAAYAKLAQLRTALIPAGSAQAGDDPTERRVNVKSGADDGNLTFIELTFNDEWRKTTGDVLHWDMHITNADITQGDVKTGFINVIYAGTVLARGATTDIAYTTAVAMARSLGDNKAGMKIKEGITRNEKLFQTDGGICFVPVDFSFEYQLKGSATYLEITADRTTDTFGQTVETVTGFIAAPTLAAAAAAYAINVRGLTFYQDKLLLNEKTPTIAQQNLVGQVAQDERFNFSFSVQLAKGASDTAMDYYIEPSSNLLTLEKITTVRGVIYAADAATANGFLDNFLSSLPLGQKTSSSRPEKHRQGGTVATGSSKTDVFLGLDFTEVFSDRLTGINGVLECEVSSAVEYSGTRWVSKPVPTGPDVVQNCGIKPGRRTVTGTVTGTTEAVCVGWAKKCRAALLTGSGLTDGGPYEEAPTITTRRRWAARVDGTPTGTGADVRVYEAQFTFSELLPQFPFVP